VGTVAICPAAVVYGLADGPRSGRAPFTILASAVAVMVVLMLRLPWVRIIGSRWQEPVFVAWSVASVGVVIFGTVLEGGPRSPVIVLLFLQLVWMGLAYPGRLVLALSTVDVLAFLALEVVYRRPAPEAAVYALGLVIASSLTFWQTRNRAHWGRVLRESERRLSLAQAIARIGSWEWQAGSDELVMSTELLRIIGVESPAPASTLDAYLSRVHPADREIVEAAVRRAGRTGERFGREHRIVRPDGAVMSVELHGRPTVPPVRSARSGQCART
jgi:hypothetical protein